MRMVYIFYVLCFLTLYSVDSLHSTGRHGFDRAYEENDESVVIVEAVDSDGDGGGSFALVPDTKGTYIDRDRGVRTRQATDGVDDAEEEMGMERYGIRILGWVVMRSRFCGIQGSVLLWRTQVKKMEEEEGSSRRRA